MLMKSFTYVRPDTLDEALALLEEHGPNAVVLAGGTDLAVRLRTGRILPAVVIDAKRIPALRAGVTETGACLRVGAGTVMNDLITDARVRRHFLALSEAAHEVGSVQIRNRATLAGNICNASPAADTAQALLVYGAVVNLVHSTGTRSVPIDQFFKGPGRADLRRGELVESIDLPIPTQPQGAAFARATRRRGVDLATVNLACLVKASGQTLFAFGAAAPRPILVIDGSGKLADPGCSQDERTNILEGLISLTTPISDVRASHEYRRALLRVMSRRVLDVAICRLHNQEALL
jgi:carbon-monoxide dehydrogenase medium subunit